MLYQVFLRNSIGLIALQVRPRPESGFYFLSVPLQISLGLDYKIRTASNASCTGGDGTSVYVLGGIARTEVRSGAVRA